MIYVLAATRALFVNECRSRGINPRDRRTVRFLSYASDAHGLIIEPADEVVEAPCPPGVSWSHGAGLLEAVDIARRTPR